MFKIEIRAQFHNGRWICPNKCGRTYKEKFSLNRHCRKECGVEPQYLCLICSRSFKRKESLKSHSFLIHKVLHTPNNSKQPQFQQLEVSFAMNELISNNSH